MNDELLIELVRQQPVLYDMKNKKYLDNEWKTTIWEEIGAKMKVDGKDCRMKWHTLRSSYRRHLRQYEMKKHRDPKKKKWYFADRMKFLLPHIWNKRSSKTKWCEGFTPSVLEQIMQSNENEATVSEGDETFAESGSADEIDIKVEEIHSKKRKTGTVAESMTVYSLKNEKPNEDHPVLMFFKGLMPDIEELSQSTQRRFKADILQTLNYYLDVEESGGSCQVSFSKPSSNSDTAATMELY